jgi:hypothetical protein
MRMSITILVSVALTAALSFGTGGPVPLAAQTPSQAPAPASPVIQSIPPATQGDVSSIDAIVSALYDVISGPAGEARDWNRMRSLFIPGGRLMPTSLRVDGRAGIHLLAVNDYVATSGPALVCVGFTEREIARRTEQFGHIAHVFSTYEGRTETEDTVIRGINSIQLIYDGSRWWIVSVFWGAERPDNPLPARYLPGGGLQ